MGTATGSVPCGWGLPGGPCGATGGVRRYQHGWFCPGHVHSGWPAGRPRRPEQPAPGPTAPVIALEQLDLTALTD